MKDAEVVRQPIIILPNEGREYAMGRMRAVFKADTDETADRYSVSEWWLEPLTKGPGVHEHPDDHVYYVITGTLSAFVGDAWSHLKAGAYVLIPGGTPHSFENRGEAQTGFISFNAPGGFERKMSDIVAALSAEDLRLPGT